VSEEIVRAEGVRAAHGEGRLAVAVLEGANFSIRRGERVAVTGPSGCGKTTLLSLVGGLDRVRGGRLLVEGADLATATPAALAFHRRTRVGFVFQFFHLLPTLDAGENVEAGLEPLDLSRRERRRRAAEALDRVGLGALASRFPHELSGGEQQRVAVARAWAKDPPLLLADEPTGNLDEDSGRAVLELLLPAGGSSPGRTVIVATHDAEVAARAGRVLRIEHRAVVES
jgi:putative ABC transport system ATP-binding protein